MDSKGTQVQAGKLDEAGDYQTERAKAVVTWAEKSRYDDDADGCNQGLEEVTDEEDEVPPGVAKRLGSIDLV